MVYGGAGFAHRCSRMGIWRCGNFCHYVDGTMKTAFLAVCTGLDCASIYSAS